MRFVVARRIGRRGEGLGNEMLAWGKGFIASQILDATLVGPSWGLNKRRYYRNFQTSRLDFVLEELLAHLPHYEFTEYDYLQSGSGDFGDALSCWASQRGLLHKSSFILIVDGMYGGYSSIRDAREFLWSKLLASRDALKNMYQITSELDPKQLFVAVHLRLGGDFNAVTADEQLRGRFNVRIPTAWYVAVCRYLRQAFGDQIRFHFFSDRQGPDVSRVIEEFNPGQPIQSGLTECSDLAVMAAADLRVCSVSSYSLMASFLAQKPYIWYEPQLTYEDSCYSLWGHEEKQRLAGSPTQQALKRIKDFSIDGPEQDSFQGYPVKNNGKIPLLLLSRLKQILQSKSHCSNLLEYGAVPEWVLKA